MRTPSKSVFAGAAAVVALAIGGAGIATASGDSGTAGSAGDTDSAAEEAHHAPDSSGSRLDDGADLLPQAGITEQEAIAAAQTAATGPLNEVDLEDYEGTLVFNVDVGSHDVKVDAASGKVLAAPEDD